MKLENFQIEALKSFVVFNMINLTIAFLFYVFGSLEGAIVIFSCSGYLVLTFCVGDFLDGNSLGNWKPFKEKFSKDYHRRTIISESITLPFFIFLWFVYIFWVT